MMNERPMRIARATYPPPPHDGAGALVSDRPQCPGEHCKMCNGEACNWCGAGCWRNPKMDGIPCDHDAEERHRAADHETLGGLRPGLPVWEAP